MMTVDLGSGRGERKFESQEHVDAQLQMNIACVRDDARQRVDGRNRCETVATILRPLRPGASCSSHPFCFSV